MYSCTITLGASSAAGAIASNSSALCRTELWDTTGARRRTHGSTFFTTTGNVALAANAASSLPVAGQDVTGAGIP